MGTPRRPSHPARLIVLLVLGLTSVLAAACKDRAEPPPPGPTIERPDTSGEPRTIRLGLGALPANSTPEAYLDAVATAGAYADVVLIQRIPPWEEFLPGGSVASATTATTQLEVALARQYELQIFFAIDPTDSAVQRSRLAGLPAEFGGSASFSDPRLRSALVSYVAYVASNYRPAYLAIGVEIDMYAERQPEDFEAFVAAYREAYAVARAASPETKIFPTFQLEDLEGNFGTVHPPRWDLLDHFSGQLDALAISSYPFLARLPSARELRQDYYRQLRDKFDGEILVAESGYPSAPVEGSSTIGTEEDQRAFLERLLTDAEESGFAVVVWTAPFDPPVVPGGTGSAFSDIGLRRADGANKAAWVLWEEWARRPLSASSR